MVTQKTTETAPAGQNSGVIMHEAHDGTKRTIYSVHDCENETERLAFAECTSRRAAVAFGTTIAEPLR